MSNHTQESNTQESNLSENENNHYTPPKVWTNDKENGGKFASTNRQRLARAMSRRYQ